MKTYLFTNLFYLSLAWFPKDNTITFTKISRVYDIWKDHKLVLAISWYLHRTSGFEFAASISFYFRIIIKYFAFKNFIETVISYDSS